MEISSKGGRVQPHTWGNLSSPKWWVWTPGTWLVFTDYIHAVFAHVSSKAEEVGQG